MLRQLAILVIDDELDIAELMAELLDAQGHQTRVALTAVAAMEMLHMIEFDLVITDFMMPVMDGLELVRLMRTEDRLARVPVIVISAHLDGARKYDEGLVQGMLQKPFMPKTLFEPIDQVMDGRGTMLAPSSIR